MVIESNHKREDNLFNHIISFPFIWMMLIPIMFLDFFIEIFHNICFRLYGIDLVERSKYVKLDRHKLSKLNPIEKIFCSYCGYANGVLAYSVEIAGRTEQYWCAIKHDEDSKFMEPNRHKKFDSYTKYK